MSHLKGSEALTLLAPLDEAFKGECMSRVAVLQHLNGLPSDGLFVYRKCCDESRPQKAADQSHCKGTAVF